MELFSIVGNIFVNGEEAVKSITDVEKKAEGMSGKLGKGIKSAGKIGLGAAAAIGTAVTGAFAATNKLVGGFDDIAKTAPKLGVSTDTLQEMDYWAGQNGVSSGDMEKAIGRLNQRMGMAADGNEKYSNALTKLGVDMDGVKNGTVSTDDAMAQSIQTLSQMENEQEKVALASELFGTKLSRELMPALQDGSLSIEEAKEKAEELGIVIDGETLAGAEDFADSWDDITRSLSIFGQKVLAELIPVFQTMMDWVIDHMPQIQAIMSKVFDVIGTVTKVTADIFREYIMPVLQSMYDWVQANLPAIQAVWEVVWNTIKGVVQGAVKYIGGLIKLFTGILTGDFDMMREAMTQIWEGAWQVITSILEGAWGLLSGAFSNLKDSIVNWFKGLIEDFKSFGSDLISGMWNGIKDKTDWLVEKIKGLGNLVTGAVKKLFGIKSPSTVFAEIGRNLIEGLGVGIDGQRKGIIGQVSDLAKELTSKAMEMDLDAKLGVSNASGRVISNKDTTGGNLDRRIDSVRGTTQHITINSPKALNPSETAREMKSASRRLALEV